MLRRTPYLSRVARTPSSRPAWRRIPVCCYSSTATDNPPWFDEMRAEMLQRDSWTLREDMIPQPEKMLVKTLRDFLPQGWCMSTTVLRPVLPVGHHLVWFNAAPPTAQLLPDGTDNLHSPSDPTWARRMWAGGSVRIRPDMYYDRLVGFAVGAATIVAERITDVQLHGKDEAAKIFVTIERRIAREDQLYNSYRAEHPQKQMHASSVYKYFKQQQRDDSGWGDALLKEERVLVFLKERTAAELDAIKAGQMAPVRYLDRPQRPDFSHTITPTRALLFRYSALTFNAHLIHLDRDYARNVEGHRNILVHGPLTITFLLQAVTGFLKVITAGHQVIVSIEYRNLAPLYCDEKMTICGAVKETSTDASKFEVWIEGPTGGVAVKGVVRAIKRPRNKTPRPALTPVSEVRKARGPIVPRVDAPPNPLEENSTRPSGPNPRRRYHWKSTEVDDDEPEAPVRKYTAMPYEDIGAQAAGTSDKFASRGVRKIEMLRIRPITQVPEKETKVKHHRSQKKSSAKRQES